MHAFGAGDWPPDVVQIIAIVRLLRAVKLAKSNARLWELPLVELSIAEGKLTLHVRGADKLWALKSSLEIPLVHIAGVRADPEAARGWYHGLRLPGTNIPGVITAGT